MVTVISLEDFTLKLKEIFCNENKGMKTYSEVWLSEADFGGLYQSQKLIFFY